MKIGLIGYGKMGKLIEKHALAKGHTISGIVTSKDSFSACADADLLIDFTHPDAAFSSIKKAAEMKKNLVMGTTGWHTHLVEAQEIVEKSGIGFLYAPNFSIGMALFFKMVAHAAALMQLYPNYDVSGIDIHHKQKVDAPSGTTRALMEQIKQQMPRLNNQLDFGCVRVGMVPGTNSVIFDSAVDTITLTHSARNREGFVEGAIVAAEWLKGKKGFYKFEDMFLDKIQI